MAGGTGKVYPKFYICLATATQIATSDVATAGDLTTFLSTKTEIDNALKGSNWKLDGEEYELTTGIKPRSARTLELEITETEIDYDRYNTLKAYDGELCYVYVYDSSLDARDVIIEGDGGEGILLHVDIEAPGGEQNTIKITGKIEKRERSSLVKFGKIGGSSFI